MGRDDFGSRCYKVPDTFSDPKAGKSGNFQAVDSPSRAVARRTDFSDGDRLRHVEELRTFMVRVALGTRPFKALKDCIMQTAL
jgi:hypothetical protein